ncbi:F-box/kelch-repeat protein At3g06240-like [Silene latifolia]|uniref:F-box/kelch-repeat protein At3g06240-like n=1 Tax=Silene latifolia TaxID=37657 RepID=UPI003D770FCA
MKSRRRKKVKSNSNKHSEFNYLPPEVWTQILLSLPAKTLLRFRCVCKSWCSIIDNPHFVNMHFKLCKFNSGHNKKKLLVALQELGKLGYEGCLLTVRNAENLRYAGSIFRIYDSYSNDIIGSCNGLLLVKRYCTSDFPYHYEFRLWNPCIRKSLIIPTCPLVNCRYLLGFAPDSQDYKVVGFAFDLTRGEEYAKMYIAVYTLGNPQWIVRNDPLNILNCYPRRGLFHSLSAALFSQGAAYCLVRNDKENSRVLTHVASFDLDKENITFLELPFSLEETGSLRLLFLFLLGGSLALFSISEVTSSIWVLDQDNKKGPWTMVLRPVKSGWL